MKLKTLITDNFSKFELLFLGLVLASFFMTHFLKSSNFSLELIIFGLVLAVAYFGFGFILLGKPFKSNGLWISITCGVVYSLSLISILVNSTELVGKDVFLTVAFSLLILLLGLLLFLNKKSGISKIYLKGQLLRMAVFALLNLVLCFI